MPRPCKRSRHFFCVPWLGQSVAVIATRIVAPRRVIAAIVSVGLRVAVRWITVAVAVRGIAITVGSRRQRAGDHTGGDPGTNPAADASRFGRLRRGHHRCGNTAGRDNRRDCLTHLRILLVLLSQKVAADGEENLEGYVRSGGTGSGASGWSATSHKPD